MFTERTEVKTDLNNVFHWNYEVLSRRWIVSTRTPSATSGRIDHAHWDRPIEREVIDMSMMPMFQTELYRSLSAENKEQLMRKFAAWRLSQFLHGEQGALMVCGQLVEAAPDLDAKMCAAAQVWMKPATSRAFASHHQARQD